MMQDLMLRAAVFAQAPDSQAKEPGELGDKVRDAIGYAKWLGFGIAVIMLVVAALSMTRARHRGESEGFTQVAMVCGAVAIISTAASIVGLFM